jgi:hypothetical protein
MSVDTFRARHPGLVWSNSQAGEAVLIRAALLRPRFHTIMDACLEFGLKRVQSEWDLLRTEAKAETQRVESETARILRNITEGIADAQAAD